MLIPLAANRMVSRMILITFEELTTNRKLLHESTKKSGCQQEMGVYACTHNPETYKCHSKVYRSGRIMGCPGSVLSRSVPLPDQTHWCGILSCTGYLADGVRRLVKQPHTVESH